ncbi:MAG TPA: NAD(P)/FAD-dependent oxidoreductase [Thermoanaerobaculia bacterium]|nr:NAD(P)/FAD-dependent oxidoreductase [Thermoanaerobaculia bacterium]
MKHFDVTIIGAGLAGLQCARLLAQRGLSVLIADRKADLTRAIHTTGIFVRRTLETFDLAPSLLGPPVRRVVLYSPRGKAQVLESPYAEFRVGRMGRIYEDFLAEAIGAGAVWMPCTAFRAAVPDRRGSLLLLDAEGSSMRVTTRFLVGADGARSRVAAALGLSENRDFLVGTEELLDGVPLAGPPALHCFLDPIVAPGYIGWAVHDGEQVHLGAGGRPDAFAPVPALAAIRRRAEKLFDLTNARTVERRGGKIPVGGILQSISCPRGLLIGDAAGAVSPLTAGGLDGALRLSRFAAEILAAAVERDDAAILALYSGAEFRARFLSRRWMRRALSLVRSPHLAEAGCAVMRTPLFSRFAWRVFFGRGSFPEPDRAPLRRALALRPIS